MDKYFLQYQLMLKPIFLHLGDYRECLLVVWNTLNYTVLTSTITTVPMHDVIWDPSTVNEFVSVGTAGRHSALFESNSLVCFISLHNAQVRLEYPDDLKLLAKP